MATFSRMSIRQCTAITVATLLLSSWSGTRLAHSRSDPADIRIPPVIGDGPARPRTSLPPQPSWLSADERQQIQSALRQRGYYSGAIDGVFGEQTQQAIREYQRESGDAVTGSLTPQEADRLLPPRPPASTSAPQESSGCAGPRF